MAQDAIDSISFLTGMQHCDEFGSYLEVPILSRRATNQSYRGLVDKVNKRLSSWKAKHLSLAGRATLVQLVTNIIANYTMQTTKLPASVSKEIDALNRNFLWGGSEDRRRVALVKWETMFRPKKAGGLGLRKTSDMNKALFAKLGWKIESGDEGLSTKVIRAKHLKGTSLFEVTKQPVASHTWRSILWSGDVEEIGL